jgi:predicted signal transduction protein with EAL and GGDEF domain
METKPRQRLEKEIEAEIIRNLALLGFQVSKTSQPRPSMLTLGIPDLYAVHARWRLRFWVEVKRPGNGPSPAQLAWHEAEREAGGCVLIARSWSDVQRALVKMGAPIPPPR